MLLPTPMRPTGSGISPPPPRLTTLGGLTPQQVIAARGTQAVQVTMADGSRRVLEHPHITGDSLVGRMDGSESHVAVADITRVASRRVSTLKTTLLVGSLAILILGAAAGQSLNESRISFECWMLC